MAQMLQATVTFERTSGVPRDRVENTFAFVAQSGSPLVPGDLAGSLDEFYNAANTTHKVGQYINRTVSRALPATIRFYDLAPVVPGPGTVLGPPIFTSEMSLTAEYNEECLPDQVAVCLSFQSDYGATPEHSPGARPRARDRGRIFIGPLIGGNEVIQLVDGVCRVRASMMQDLGDAAQRLAGNLSDGGVALWAVWSRKNKALTEVTHGWVDNKFDTQRRRALEATVRDIWP